MTAIGFFLMRKCQKKAPMVVSGSPRLSAPKEKGQEKEKEKEEEVVQKTVYLCLDSLNDNSSTDWYITKLSSSKDYCPQKKKRKKGGGGKEQLCMELVMRNSPIPSKSCCVRLGSTIYSIAPTSERVSSQVLACDTTNITTTGMLWQPVAAMNRQRDCQYTTAVTADGKIYVFGGLEISYARTDFLCEVFDPAKNMWEAIEPPPIEQSLHWEYSFFAVYDETSGRIILGSLMDEFLIHYNVRAATWDSSISMPDDDDEDEDGWTVHTSNPALVDGTIYWINVVENHLHQSGLYAYDLKQNMLLRGEIVGIHYHFWDNISSSMQFLHFRGDEFYLFWRNFADSMVMCERIRVSKRIDMEEGKGSLAGYVISTKTSYSLGQHKCNPDGIRSVML